MPGLLPVALPQAPHGENLQPTVLACHCGAYNKTRFTIRHLGMKRS